MTSFDTRRKDKIKSCRNCANCSSHPIDKKYQCSENSRKPWPKSKHFTTVSCKKFKHI